MFGVRPDNFRKTWITCCRLFGEVAWLKSFYSALCLQILLLQLFPPISHLIRRSRPTVYLSLLTPSILHHGYLVKSLAKTMKSLRGFKKLSRRSTMTRPWQEWRYNRLSKAKYKKRRRRRPIREILTQSLPSPIWLPNWRMTGKRMSGNSLRPLMCWPEWFTLLSLERRSSQRSRPGGWKTVFLEDEEGAIQDLWGGRSDGGLYSLTVSDNVLTLWEAVGGKERAGRPYSRSGGLL
jgi:hypothetical protein